MDVTELRIAHLAQSDIDELVARQDQAAKEFHEAPRNMFKRATEKAEQDNAEHQTRASRGRGEAEDRGGGSARKAIEPG